MSPIDRLLSEPWTYPVPMPQPVAAAFLKWRHREYEENLYTWMRLLDSLEAGKAYRENTYGYDWRGQPAYNLVRHKRDLPDSPSAASVVYGRAYPTWQQPATDPSSFSTHDEFENRRARTPVPGHMADAVGEHCDRVYAREIIREGPDQVAAWWDDVDGMGTKIDKWMYDTVSPAFLALGQIDLQFESPSAPPGPAILTLADAVRAGVRGCRASILLPGNMLWWSLDADEEYSECLVRECCYTRSGRVAEKFRHWTKTHWFMYEIDGKIAYNGLGQPMAHEHGLGRVPIFRHLFRRKFGTQKVGRSNYETIADYMREIYNRDSELMLSDSLQSNPTLQGPAKYITETGTILVGPGRALAIDEDKVGWSYVTPDKSPAESIRMNIASYENKIDRAAATAKPAGEANNPATVTGQSGISKAMDNIKLSNALKAEAASLGILEMKAAEYALMVTLGRRPTPGELAGVRVEYPGRFNLFSLGEIIAAVQGLIDFSGIRTSDLPEFFKHAVRAVEREILPSLDDAQYEELDAELDAYIDREAEESLTSYGPDPSQFAAFAENARNPPPLPPPQPNPGGRGQLNGPPNQSVSRNGVSP